MKSAYGFGLAILLSATVAQAETAPSLVSDSGIIHRLTEAEKEALFDRIAHPACPTRPARCESHP